jgi:hypothetical protein
MKARPTLEKRRKELARQERKQAKLRRRQERRERQATAPLRQAGEDPDLAGVLPGPQPTPEAGEDSDA